MRRMTAWMMAFALVSVGLLGACDDDYTPGEGARRYGAVNDDAVTETASATTDIGAAAVVVKKPKKTPTKGSAPKATRGSGRKKKGGKKTKYTVLKDGVKDGGTISGTIKLAAGDPGLQEIVVNKDVELCKHDKHASERLVMNPETRGVADCVVRLEKITKGKDWPEAMRSKERVAVIDQVECKYVPHIQVVRAKTQLEVRNSDPAEHNIHGYYNTMAQTVFNFYTPVGAAPMKPGAAYLAEKKGLYLVKCDIHPWMNATVVVTETPYFAVTDKDGKFEIKDVPPGKYRLVAWHESLKEEAQVTNGEISTYNYGEDWEEKRSVEVAAGATVTADFEIPLP